MPIEINTTEIDLDAARDKSALPGWHSDASIAAGWRLCQKNNKSWFKHLFVIELSER